MTQMRAKIVLLASAVLLAAVGVAWSRSGGEDRSDLRGQEVRAAGRASSTAASPVPGAPPPSVAPTTPATTLAPTTTVAPVARPGVPVSIAIPSLAVDAPIVPVGIEDDGAMEIPGAVEAGWYRFGPRPGAPTGSAVLAGHVDHKKTPGVFLELRRLDVGAEVSVVDDGGTVHRFVVTERFQVDKDELPAADLFRRDGDPVLTLITCGGAFDRRARSYEDNIVIRAVPAPEEPARPLSRAAGPAPEPR
jgi:LPXTG-site transpeptidase (sortase) family protein